MNISHQGKRKIIFKHTLGWDMLVPRRVHLYVCFHQKVRNVFFVYFFVESSWKIFFFDVSPGEHRGEMTRCSEFNHDLVLDFYQTKRRIEELAIFFGEPVGNPKCWCEKCQGVGNAALINDYPGYVLSKTCLKRSRLLQKFIRLKANLLEMTHGLWI